ncbi:PREDICTED: pumilio homolog 11-like [Camelina sativa]|uniref:Pumilio homolog 11-like n=1 Tax=Camelina sativa TaxID=90675 RepID=A0ABM0U5V3_CAMSA|nr:PREDICTED: pumilio homolog 11-like [Camelina sativa]
MDFGFFPSDLRQRGSYSDLGFGGFPLPSSVSNGFHFSGHRTAPPPITNPFLNLNTMASMAADTDLGLCQSLRKLSISDERSSFLTPVLNQSGFHGSRSSFHGCSKLDLGPEGLVQSFHHGEASSMRGYGDLHRLDQDLMRARREGFVQSFHGESSMSRRYVGVDDDHRLRLLGLQEAGNPNPSFNHPRGFTENMSLRNRDYMFEHFNQQIRRDVSLIPQKSRLDFQENDVLDPLMYSGNRTVPPFSAMGGSRELEGLKNNTSFEEELLDLPLTLASMVDIYGSVYLMAKDQLGCRCLQKLIEERRFLDVMIIFEQVINHVTELGMDQFGNYFVQKLLQVCDEEQRTQILIRLTSKPGLLVKISINNYGTRVVQKLIETVSTKEQISLLKSALKPGFLSLVRELNGNHVILSCLRFLDPNDKKFILEAATKFCTEIATHRHGCCVLQRCISYSVGEQHEKLVGEISRNALRLAQDPYGNYVVQYIIEKNVGGVNVMFQLRGNYVRLATQKFGSHVVEKCLRYYPDSRSQIVHELVSVPNFAQLVQDPYANYVIQAALFKTKGFVRASLVEKLRRCENLKMSPYCKRIFSKNLWKK